MLDRKEKRFDRERKTAAQFKIDVKIDSAIWFLPQVVLGELPQTKNGEGLISSR